MTSTNRHALSLRLGLAMAAAAVACLLGACEDRGATEAQLSSVQVSRAEQLPQEAESAGLTIAPEHVMQPWTGDLDGMIERGFIRVLIVYSKTLYFLDNGTQRGASYDFLRQFEDDLNRQLARQKKLKKHIKLRVMFIPVGKQDLLPALIAGKGDIAAGNLTITPERSRLVDFSAPMYPDVSEVLVTGPASAAVNSVDDLSGKEVYVRRSDSYYSSLLALNQRFAAQGKPEVVIKLAPDVLDEEDQIEMVSAGLIPMTIADKHLADFWKQVFPAITVHDAIAVRTGGNIAWAMRKDSPQLKAAIDDFSARHGKGTTTGNMILTRYLKNTKHVKDATSEAERAKFRAMRDFFRKYGDKYEVDWLLMAAQGYQESQLNHDARSAVGAIGVMQIMPATGKEMNVGDIREVEANIHAGIKYMRWMIDHYYADEPMTQLDKALFAFASYNAGPGRISRLRREAARRGLDPDIWFHNVEYVAAEKIGAETVTYVSNIYKYYVAYQLISEARAAEEKARAKMTSAQDGT